MSLSVLGWLFALGVVIHNTEEALFLPAWSVRAGHWPRAVTAVAFRFAVTVLSAAVLLAAWFASSGGSQSLGAYILAVYALAMVLNVFIPHVAASVALRSYAPGTGTALLFNLPLGGWLIYRYLADGYVKPSVFLISGPVTVLVIVAAIPLLFYVGKKLIPPSN
jgi:hypothetical protein